MEQCPQSLDTLSKSDEEEELLLLLRAVSETVDSDVDVALPESLLNLQQLTSSSSEDAAEETPTRHPKAMGTVKRRKVEMEKLHRMEYKLFSGLAQLQLVANEQKRRAGVALSHAEQKAAMVQKSKAEQEAKRRQLSARENKGLRAALQRQVRLTKSLRRLLQRRMRQEAMKNAGTLCSHHEFLASIARNIRLRSDPVFDKLILGLDEVYTNVDRVFEKVGIRGLPCPGRENLAIQATSKKYVEFLDRYAVPFDASPTAGVVWSCLAELDWKGPKQLASSYFDKARNVLLSYWISSFSTGDVTIPITNCRVTRKYVEPSRTVFIAQTFIEPKSPPLIFYETVRLVVRQNGLSELGPISVMESHREAICFDKNDIVRIVPTVDRGVAAWGASITHFNHRVEDALVQNNWRNVLNT